MTSLSQRINWESITCHVLRWSAPTTSSAISTWVVLADLAGGLDADELEELSLSPESDEEEASTSSTPAAGSEGPCSGNSNLCP